MVRVYKNNTAYIVCEVKIFKNGISYGTTNSMINESYIKQIIKDPDDNSTIISLVRTMMTLSLSSSVRILLQLTNNLLKENKTK